VFRHLRDGLPGYDTVFNIDPATPVSFAAASVYPTEPSPSTPAPQPVRRRSRRPACPSSYEDPTPTGTPASRRRRPRAPPDDDDDVDAYDIETVCRKSGVGRTLVYEAINSGELVARKCRRLTRVLRTDYQAWLESWPKIIPAETAATPAPAAPKSEPSKIEPDRALKKLPKNARPGVAQ
jgi:hypothetical protein